MNIPVLNKEVELPELPMSVKFGKQEEESPVMRDVGLLILRVTTGGLLAGHGAQKLFGWFGGPGLKGTAGFLESMGLTPGKRWATAASLSEFGGGLLTALGLFHPLGPMAEMGAMTMATAKAHWGKPIWASAGGAELPLVDMASALTITLAGPGRFSLDRLFGIRMPRWLIISVAVVEAVMTVIGIMSRPPVSTTDEAVPVTEPATAPAGQPNGTL
jgi:putative oxidoreductase